MLVPGGDIGSGVYGLNISNSALQKVLDAEISGGVGGAGGDGVYGANTIVINAIHRSCDAKFLVGDMRPYF